MPHAAPADPTRPSLAGVPPAPPPDPVPIILPAGGISLLAGAPNVGKTALLASMLKALRDGVPLFGHQPNPLPAIGIVGADRGWQRGAGLWFERVGYPEVPHYAMVDDASFDPRSLRRKFERTARLFEMVDKLQLPPGSLICVDPIGIFLGGNLLDYDSCAVACHEIRVLLRDRRLTMLALAHSAKLKADKNDRYLRAQDQVLGSTAIIGCTDTQMYLASPEETGEPYYTFLWHPHAAKPESFYLSRDERGLFVNYAGSGDQGNCARVLLLLPENGDVIAFADLLLKALEIPLSPATLKRVLSTLLERGRIARAGRGAYRRVTVQ